MKKRLTEKMEKKEILKKCINCKNKYKEFMFSNYNLGLCQDCFDKFEESKIDRDNYVDEVTHRVTCPKCKKVYEECITGKKCETENCNIWFFWNDLDCNVFARWIDL